MPRIRSVHPGQWTDEDFVQCSPLARLLAIGLRNEADDRGVFEWKPTTLKMRILPADNADVSTLLDELIGVDQVVAFDHDGKRYGAIRNFRRYQRPKKPNAVHPLPDRLRKYVGLDDTGSEPDTVSDDPNSEPVPHRFPTGSENPIQMEEEGGRRKEDNINARSLRTSPRQQAMSETDAAADAEFEAWYQAFPRHVGKGQARRAYWRARKKVDADTLIDGIERYRRGKPDYADWCHPATWLNGERWEDGPDAEPARSEPDDIGPPVDDPDAAAERALERLKARGFVPPSLRTPEAGR